jgi:DUF1009 family protein
VAAAKVVKPTQDKRYDLPVVGPATIEVLVECRAAALALDASGLIILEPQRCVSMAQEGDLSIVAWKEEAQ